MKLHANSGAIKRITKLHTFVKSILTFVKVNLKCLTVIKWSYLLGFLALKFPQFYQKNSNKSPIFSWHGHFSIYFIVYTTSSSRLSNYFFFQVLSVEPLPRLLIVVKNKVLGMTFFTDRSISISIGSIKVIVRKANIICSADNSYYAGTVNFTMLTFGMAAFGNIPSRPDREAESQIIKWWCMAKPLVRRRSYTYGVLKNSMRNESQETEELGPYM